MRSLKDALLEQSPQMLRAVAETNHIDLPEGGAREQWASLLAEALGRHETVERAWQALSDGERGVLGQVALQGGRIKAFQMLRDHGEVRAFGPVALARDKPWLTPANTTERLWYLGLIQRAFDVSGDFRGEIFYIPEEILMHVPRPVASDGFAVKTVAPPETTIADGTSFMWDTFILLSYIARVEPSYVEGTLLGVDELRALDEQLLVKDSFSGKDISSAPRVTMLVRVARAAKLLRVIPEIGVRLGSETKPWLRTTQQQRRLDLFEAWRRERTWNELRFVPTLKIEETGWRNDPRLARATVLNNLAQCPPGEWISIASFIASIKRLEPDFQRPDGDYDRWHMRDAETGKLLTGFSHWNQVEGQLIKYIIEGPLSWLGVVSMGAGAFRLDEFGARALGLTDKDLPEPRMGKFVVQADFDVLVPLDAPVFARFQLERMAERVKWDRISTYRLTRESLTRLLRRNVAIEQILAFLKRIARSPFPKNVEFTLREWAAKFGEITLREGAVLHTRDQKLLAELRHHPELSAYIREVLSPTVALVPAAQIEELQAQLQKLGYSPRVLETLNK